MAHVGKGFKLHFRRDVCPGVNNYNKGHPEALQLSFFNLTAGPPGPIWECKFPLLKPVSGPNDPAMIWESDPFPCNGFDLVFRVLLDHLDMPQQFVWYLLEVYESAILRFRTLGRTGDPQRCDVQRWTPLTGTPSVYDAAFWNGGGTFFDATTTGAPWSVYP